MSRFVKAPPAFAPLFDAMEAKVAGMLEDRTWDTSIGAHLVAGERFVMYRAESMSVSIREELNKLLGSGADAALYRIGKGIGASDCRHLAGRLPDVSPEQLVALGPISFALSGFANTTILDGSNPALDDSFVLFYEHPHSYEAESFKKKGVATSTTECFLVAGYSAGWAGEALGIDLHCREVSCIARGDDKCLFVMSASSKLREVTKDFCAKNGLPSPF